MVDWINLSLSLRSLSSHFDSGAATTQTIARRSVQLITPLIPICIILLQKVILFPLTHFQWVCWFISGLATWASKDSLWRKRCIMSKLTSSAVCRTAATVAEEKWKTDAACVIFMRKAFWSVHQSFIYSYFQLRKNVYDNNLQSWPVNMRREFNPQMV